MIYLLIALLIALAAFAADIIVTPQRQYRSGTRWRAWRWTHTDTGYITRLHLIKTPWFAICLHWINGPDPEPHLHDHPVSFLSIILRGGYSETRQHDLGVPRLVRHRWWNWIRATPLDTHRIEYVEPRTLTLALMGPKVRDWGFHVPRSERAPDGWVHWKVYNDARRNGAPY